MAPMDDVVGNPIALLIERAAYLFIGIFFIAALLSSLIRSIKEKG